MALIKPAQPVNYADILMKGLGTGMQFYQMQQQQDRQDKLDIQKAQQLKMQQADRGIKQNYMLGKQLAGKTPEQQAPILQNYLGYLEKTGQDTKSTIALKDALESGDQTKVMAANQTLNQYVQGGQARGLGPKKSAIVNEAERLFPGDRQRQNTYIQRSRFKPQTQVNIGQGAGEEQKALAKSRVAQLGQIQEKAEVAQNNIYSLDRLDAIDVSTGKAEPMKQALGAWGKSFGVPIDKLMKVNIAAGQSLTAEAGRVVLNVMAAQKGPQTESDMKQIRTTVSGLGKDPRANKFINDSARAMSRRAVEQRDFFETYLDDNGTLKGAAKQWNDYKRGTPMVSKKSKDDQGLPVFFFKFVDRVKEANPGATRDQILEAWKTMDVSKGQEPDFNQDKIIRKGGQ